MKIRRTSMISETNNTLDIPNVTEVQIERYEDGAGAIQDIFPTLCLGEREFIKTGVTPREWKDAFGLCGNGTCHKKCPYMAKKKFSLKGLLEWCKNGRVSSYDRV
jgi:hypothetical protein